LLFKYLEKIFVIILSKCIYIVFRQSRADDLASQEEFRWLKEIKHLLDLIRQEDAVRLSAMSKLELIRRELGPKGNKPGMVEQVSFAIISFKIEILLYNFGNKLGFVMAFGSLKSELIANMESLMDFD
jgi:hypothetical protein